MFLYVFRQAIVCTCLFMLTFSYCYSSPVSDLGAQNLYNNVSKIATNMTVTSLSTTNNTYFFRMYQGAYDYNINLVTNEEGYVSEIFIDTNLPILAVNSLLQGDKDSIKYYYETYNALTKYGRNAAEDVAGEKAKVYARERLQKLEKMFTIYGVTGNNVINPTGVTLLAKIREEEPDKCDYYTNLYYSPKEAYMKGINFFPMNNQLFTIVNSGLVYLYMGMGLTNGEINNLKNSFGNNAASTYCSKTNRTINLKAETTLKNDCVKIHLTAS